MKLDVALATAERAAWRLRKLGEAYAALCEAGEVAMAEQAYAMLAPAQEAWLLADQALPPHYRKVKTP